MSELKAEDTTTSKITTEEFDAFFVDLAAQGAQDDRPTQRIDGVLNLNMNRENVYFYLDHIQGLASANDRASGRARFTGEAIPRNLGRDGTFSLIVGNNRDARLLIYNGRGEHVHTYSGTSVESVSRDLVGTWNGRWS